MRWAVFAGLLAGFTSGCVASAATDDTAREQTAVDSSVAAGETDSAAPTALTGPSPERFRLVQVDIGVSSSAALAAFVDGDDRLDLLVVGADQVFVLIGRGDGHFDVADAVPAGLNANDLALGDLDEDGVDDLVVANHDTEFVTLLFGGAEGAFRGGAAERFEVNVSPHPHVVSLHDVDGDGHLDLLVDDRDAEGIRLFRGLGDGSFGESSTIPVGGDPYLGMVIVDVDDDGDLDLITPNPDHVSIVVGDGRASFTQGETLDPGFDPFSAVAADLDGDGVTDIAAGSGEGPGALTVWMGRSDGTYRLEGEYEIAVGPTSLATADVTGDGLPEVIATSYVGAEIAIVSLGDRIELERIEVAGNPYGVTTGDFDGDGTADIAVTNEGAEVVTVLLARPT